MRVREAGASAAGRGQRPHASFPDQSPIVPPRWIASQSICSPPSSNRREAKKGCREQCSLLGYGAAAPSLPPRWIASQSICSPLSSNRREAKKGCREQCSLLGYGAKPHRSPPSPPSLAPPSLDAYLSPFHHRRTRSARKRIKLPVRHVLDSVVRLYRTRRRRSRRRYAVAMRRRHAPA